MSFPVCKFFRSEQGCKFGNKCRYRHSDSFSPPFNHPFDQQNQNDGSVRSSHLPRGTVNYPRYFSANPRENESSVRNPKVGNSSSSTSHSSHRYRAGNHGSSVSLSDSPASFEAQFQKLETSDHNEEAVRSHLPSDPRPTGKVCHYFARNGTCCFGSRCRFEHVRQNRAPPRFQRQHYGHPAATGLEADGQPSEPQDAKGQKGEGVNTQGEHDGNFSSSPADGSPQLGSAAQASVSKEASAAGQTAETDHGQEGTEDHSTAGTQQVKSDKICQFYLTGRCWRGNRCKFLHPGRPAESWKKKSASAGDHENRGQRKPAESSSSGPKHELKTEESSATSQSSRKVTAAPKPRAPYVAQGTKKYRRDEVDEVEACRLRRTEIEQLIKRFPKSKVKVLRDCAEYFQCVVSFSPTDPDWPFDVKVFQLQIDIPADYPFEMMTISLPNEQDLPETVRRYVEVSIEEWLENKERQLEENGQVELVFRPFLRWLDRNIEDVVTEGLKQLKREMVARASGLEFVSAKQLQKQYPGQTSKNSDDDAEEDEDDDDEDDDETGSDSQEDTSSDYGSDEEDENGDEDGEEEEESDKASKKSRQDKFKAMLADPERKGTEIMLKNLQLKESTATIYFEKLCLSIQCERCKGTSEFMATGGRVNVVQCGQCGQTQMATFRPAMAHQFSSVIGYLDLDACLPFDVILQNSSVIISCLHCSKETKPGALLPGQPQDHWCRVCHRKLRVAAEGVRFTQLEPSKTVQSIKGMVKVVVPTRKRIPKDPAIQEGKPLPNFGTCKHYKKSYRWLRFPCCGKCYPCDICHDSKEDHEMTFANRMICGFCCKEQPFAAERPCKGCDMNMTRVHTKHWEGGQGCRDKISMSRNDKHKHRNMAKTVSKHSQKVKDMQSKKKTKLRHT